MVRIVLLVLAAVMVVAAALHFSLVVVQYVVAAEAALEVHKDLSARGAVVAIAKAAASR